MDTSRLRDSFRRIQDVEKPEFKVKINNPNLIQQRVRSRGWFFHEKEALYYFFEKNDLQKTKQSFYTCARIDEYRIRKYDNHVLQVGIQNLTYILLSDHFKLIQQFGTLASSKLPLYAPKGSLTHTVQCIIRDDIKAIENQVNIFQSKYLPFKSKQWVKPDLQFFEGYLEGNSKKMAEAITTLVSPRRHHARNKPFALRKEYISIPALTYTKLAWLKGFELDINHPLVPRALLPVQPLEKYVDEYDFLKELDEEI